MLNFHFFLGGPGSSLFESASKFRAGRWCYYAESSDFDPVHDKIDFDQKPCIKNPSVMQSIQLMFANYNIFANYVFSNCLYVYLFAFFIARYLNCSLF